MSYVIGIDLGGTKIELGLIAPDNTVIARKRIAAQTEEGATRVTERILEVIRDLELSLPRGEQLAAVGICGPGPLDNETGTFRDPPNIPGLHHAPLGPMLAEKLGVPVTLEHDAKAAALGEYHYGAGRGQKNMVYIVAGTGVGGAMIENGQLIRGVQNAAGEIGHITLDRNGVVCNCGSRGCSQTYIAGPYLAKRYEEKQDKETRDKETRDKGQGEKSPSLLSAVSQSALTGEDIANLAKQGDNVAQEVMCEAGEALGVMIAILAVTLDSELYVIGGSVAKAGDLILQPARDIAPQYALSSIAPRIKIVASSLGDDAPLLGCAYLARQLSSK